MANSELSVLTKRLDEIKEAWQIYSIFEEAKAAFNAEMEQLTQDKQALMDAHNDISAKNAMLRAENDELGSKINAKKSELAELEARATLLAGEDEFIPAKHDFEPVYDSAVDEMFDALDLALATELESSCDASDTVSADAENLRLKIAEICGEIPEISAPEAEKKVRIIYQKQQRLLATPASEYVLLEAAQGMWETLEMVRSRLMELKTSNPAELKTNS